MEEGFCVVYVFRSQGFAPSGDTVVAVAPIDRVISVYGNGGIVGEGGLSAVFGGAVVFKNENSGQYFAGVWGARNASRFRANLRAQMRLTIVEEPPAARCLFWETQNERSKRTP